MEGLLQMGAPEGPHSCVPTLFFLVYARSSGMVYVFQICLPVEASSATMLPRKRQHS